MRKRRRNRRNPKVEARKIMDEVEKQAHDEAMGKMVQEISKVPAQMLQNYGYQLLAKMDVREDGGEAWHFKAHKSAEIKVEFTPELVEKDREQGLKVAIAQLVEHVRDQEEAYARIVVSRGSRILLPGQGPPTPPHNPNLKVMP